jgi:AraC-like DNA-binding protein
MSENLKPDNFFLYLPIHEQNIRWGLYLTGVGFCRVGQGQPYPPKGHPDVYNFRWETGRVLPEYQILLIAEGSGTFESSKTEKTTVNAGDVMLLFPGLWHRYRPAENGWKEYWLSWNGELLYRILKQGLLDPRRSVLKAENPAQILAAFERIIAHVQTYPAGNSNVLSAYAMEVLTLALQNEQTPQLPNTAALPVDYAYSVDDPIVFKALQMIWNHSYRDFRVDDLVRQLPVTRRTLERKFIQTMGHSIGDEIIRCRLERAKHLLANTALPVKHIALSVGFASADRMGKVFQELLHMPPTLYRRQFRRVVPEKNSQIQTF